MGRYQVFWRPWNGQRVDISARAGGLSLSDDLDSLAVSLSLDVMQSSLDPFFKPLDIAGGDRIALYKDGALVLDGQVNVTSGDLREKLSVTAYDEGIVLGKNDLIIQCNGLAADEAIRRVCARLGVPVGELPSMPTAITKIYRQGVSAVLKDILDTVAAETGRRYFVRCTGGMLAVRPYGWKVADARCWEADNLDLLPIQLQPGTPSVKRSIEELRNVVRVYTDKDDAVSVLGEAVHADSVARYGQRVALEAYSDKDGATAGQKARTRLVELDRETEEIALQVRGADEVSAGCLLDFDMREISGHFLVKAVTKNFGDPYTMDLTLERWKG